MGARGRKLSDAAADKPVHGGRPEVELAAELAAPETPEGFFEGTGCVLTLRHPQHKSGNRVLRVAHTAAQVRDRLRRGEFAKFDRLTNYTVRQEDDPAFELLREWDGWTVFHEIHVRASEVVLIDEREFGVAVGLTRRWRAMVEIDPAPWWKFWAD